MQNIDWSNAEPEPVLDFWFPEDGHYESVERHERFWTWRMRGEADDAICKQFTELTTAAATGLLDHWAKTPQGRLPLIIALDQFPRSMWRDTPAAFAQDIKATRLALDGLENDHFNQLTNVWEKQFFLIAISHCEGPDHLERMDRIIELAATLVPLAPKQLQSFYELGLEHNEIVRNVIVRFGRHPHRNAVLGRTSSPEEVAYIADGNFPHQRSFPEDLSCPGNPQVTVADNNSRTLF